MRILVSLCVAMLAASCATRAQDVAPAKPARAATSTIALQNAGFEDRPVEGRNCAPSWNCAMHADPSSFRFSPLETGMASGARSYCIEAVGKEPWANLSQVVRDTASVRGLRVRFSAAVKLESVTGEGAGPFSVAQGSVGQVIKASKSLATGEKGWQRMEVEMDVPQATTLLEVGVTFRGRGRACIDDARLEIVPPPGAV